jgi:hypothetical protein
MVSYYYQSFIPTLKLKDVAGRNLRNGEWPAAGGLGI